MYEQDVGSVTTVYKLQKKLEMCGKVQHSRISAVVSPPSKY